jgi:hypothetical protein
MLAGHGQADARLPGPCWETMSTISAVAATTGHGQALLKLYHHETKYRREVTALGRLALSEYAPDLYAHGELAYPIAVYHQRSDSRVAWRYFILRTWFAGIPGDPPPSDQLEAFFKAVFAFCDHCALYGLRVGDMKRDAFIWHAGRLTWIDYDGFSVTGDYRQRVGDENRRYVRSRLERLGIGAEHS